MNLPIDPALIPTHYIRAWIIRHSNEAGLRVCPGRSFVVKIQGRLVRISSKPKDDARAGLMKVISRNIREVM
jgi:hypothetical protein